MDKTHFQKLVKSIREMKQIQKGKLEASRVRRFDAVSIKTIRHKLHQSQSEFAFMIGVSPATLKNWEQGLREPEGPARALLAVAQKNPAAVYQALHG